MAVIILAGGCSKRMGQVKALLDIGGATLIQSLVTRFAGNIGQVVVVLRLGQETAVCGAVLTHDVYKGVGPLGGLHAGLLASSDEVCFLLACDMPFASLSLASYIVSLAPSYDAVVPMLDRGPEPLHAAYAKSCIPIIESAIDSGCFRMRDVLEQLNVLYVPEDKLRDRDPDLRSFLNVNTPSDYCNAVRLMQASVTDIRKREELTC